MQGAVSVCLIGEAALSAAASDRTRVTFMALTISSAFDAGNIRVLSQTGDRVDLEIAKDHMSDFYQWFYFRLAGGEGREVTLRIVNCAGSAYPNGWPDYKAVVSADREEWLRVHDT